MDTPADIPLFWSAFAADESRLQALPLQERMEQGSALLEQHLSGLALELLGRPDDALTTLVLTAHGSVEHFPRLVQVAAAAPPLRHHRVVAFRERMADADFPLGMEGFELSTSDVLVALEPDNGQVALELRFAREIPPDCAEHARNMAFIMMDHVLGEYDFAVKVGAVDFVADDGDAGRWTRLSELPAVFDAYWVEVLGRTGRFPVGGPAWDSMELQFGVLADEALDEQEGPEGGEPMETGVVEVNTHANAVAMRADLAYALTLDLAVPDAATLAAVRNLQDQAGTLLELPQLGICAIALQRAGRRQALYYVSDEALARQALAPLLLRAEAESLVLKWAFDPSWSGYFEFASFLDGESDADDWA